MKKRMTEEIKLQPSTGCKLCQYQMTDVCIPCQEDSQFNWFTQRQNLTLVDLPPFPAADFQNGMPLKMRQIVVGIYMEIIIRTLQEGI
jgi:hypothetical protein